jgi:hypothetical protein
MSAALDPVAAQQFVAPMPAQIGRVAITVSREVTSGQVR